MLNVCVPVSEVMPYFLLILRHASFLFLLDWQGVVDQFQMVAQTIVSIQTVVIITTISAIGLWVDNCAENIQSWWWKIQSCDQCCNNRLLYQNCCVELKLPHVQNVFDRHVDSFVAELLDPWPGVVYVWDTLLVSPRRAGNDLCLQYIQPWLHFGCMLSCWRVVCRPCLQVVIDFFYKCHEIPEMATPHIPGCQVSHKSTYVYWIWEQVDWYPVTGYSIKSTDISKITQYFWVDILHWCCLSGIYICSTPFCVDWRSAPTFVLLDIMKYKFWRIDQGICSRLLVFQMQHR